jgi:TnpA family transposase
MSSKDKEEEEAGEAVPVCKTCLASLVQGLTLWTSATKQLDGLYKSVSQINVGLCCAADLPISFSVASVSGDLSSLTAPPFILSPISLTEFPGM